MDCLSFCSEIFKKGRECFCGRSLKGEPVNFHHVGASKLLWEIFQVGGGLFLNPFVLGYLKRLGVFLWEIFKGGA